MAQEIHEIHHDEGMSGALVFLGIIIALVVVGLLLWRFVPQSSAPAPSGTSGKVEVNIPSNNGGTGNGGGSTNGGTTGGSSGY